MSKENVPAQDENELIDDLQNEENQEEQHKEKQEEQHEEKHESSEDKLEETSDENLDEKVERPVWSMPVVKAQKEKEKAVAKALAEKEEEFNQKLESVRREYESKINSGQNTSSVDDKLKRFAEEKGLDADSAKGLLDIFKESINIPDMSKYDQILKQQEIEATKMQVNNEIENDIVPLIQRDFPNASQEHLINIKNEIAKLAFTKRFHTYALSDIYAVNKNKWEVKDKHTAEDSGGRTINDDISSLSEEEALKLSPSEYSEWMDAQMLKESRYKPV